MAVNKNHKQYWRRTRRFAVLCLAGPMIGLLFLPAVILALDSTQFLGFPLGYLLASHGMIGTGFFLVTWFLQRQDAIDIWHGANEDI